MPRGRAGREAVVWRPRERCHRSDSVGQSSSDLERKQPAVGVTSDEDLLGRDAERCLKKVEQSLHESEIIQAGRPVTLIAALRSSEA